MPRPVAKHSWNQEAKDILNRPAPVEPPKYQMRWEEYQGWIDRLRGEGYTLTTHRREGG